MATTIADIEQASLQELGNTHIDEVLVLLDDGLERLPSYSELYYRWERQQWKAKDLDFTQDKLDMEWIEREYSEEMLEQTRKTNASFWIGEHQVTVDLLPFVLAAPDTEQKLFLTTQVVDGARHMVFFDRFYTEVMGSRGKDLHTRIRWAGVVHDQLMQTLPLSLTLINDSEPTVFGFTQEQINEWALRSLDKRLRVIRVPNPLG